MEIQRNWGAFFVLGLVSFFIFAGFTASASSLFDITFPIPELGNCANNNECKSYCDDLANKDACTAFSVKHGFAKKEDVTAVKKLPGTGPGGCSSGSECQAYCAHEDNINECVSFAEKHGIGREVRERAKLIRTQGGPGNCQSAGECYAYCDDPAHQEECFAFGERNKFISAEKIAVQKRVMEGGGPGGCRGEEACRTYCENHDNSAECITFAEEHNLISKEEAGRIRKMPSRGPGGCRGDACRTYCDDPAHQEECFKFAEEHDLIPKEELERARRFAGRPGPGGCRGEACRTYCEDEAHRDECFKFAEENDLMPRQELERARKMMKLAQENGPGGCRGEACRTYCEDEAHRTECFEFAKKHNLIPAEEIERAEKGMRLQERVQEVGGPGGCKSENECHTYCLAEAHVEECLAFAVNQGGFNEHEAKQMLREFTERRHGPPEFRHGEFGPPGGFEGFDKFNEERFKRFDEFRKLDQQFRGEMMEGGTMRMENFQGPGGCNSPESCIKFCSDPANRDECARFNPGRGGMPPGEMFREGGPGKGDEGCRIRPRCLDAEPRCLLPEPTGGWCAEGEFPNPQFENRGMPGPGSGSRGPGGCSSREECAKYCSDPARAEECARGLGPRPEGGTFDRRMPVGSFSPRPGDGFPSGAPQGSFVPRPGMDMMYPGFPGGEGQHPPEGTYRPPEGSYMPPPPQETIQPQSRSPVARFLSAIVSGFGMMLGILK